jgi:hypothetical protein
MLDRLGEQEPDKASGDLATVLRTPLTVTLARTLHSDTSGQNPAEPIDLSACRPRRKPILGGLTTEDQVAA